MARVDVGLHRGTGMSPRAPRDFWFFLRRWTSPRPTGADEAAAPVGSDTVTSGFRGRGGRALGPFGELMIQAGGV